MKRFFTILLLSIITMTVSAQSMFDIMLRKAQAGDSKAQNDVAAYYREGYSVQRDYQKAIYWYRKSAAQGDPVGLYGLGQCYAMGIGVSQNSQIAAGYILSAAQKGLREAQQAIAFMYERGMGVPQDLSKAAYWRQMAQH
jgi:TPR repeat protein